MRIPALILASVLGLSCVSRFPIGTFSNADEDRLISAQLRAAREPSIAPTGVAGKEVYRFSFVPGDRPSALVRVVRRGDQYMLFAKRLSGSAAEPGTVGKRVRRELTEAETDQLRAWLTGMAFWGLPSADPSKNAGRGVEDVAAGPGEATWILEGADRDRYHVVVRRSRETQSVFDQLCTCLLVWSGIEEASEDLAAQGGSRDGGSPPANACGN